MKLALFLENNKSVVSRNAYWVGSLLAFTLIRLAYGVMLIAVLFVPFGVYHSRTEPYVAGALWGFLLPVGYIAAASGITVILYPRSTLLRKLRFGYLLMLIGSLMLLSLWAFPSKFFINLIHGTSFSYGWIDIDYAIGNAVVFWLSLLSFMAGIAVIAKHRVQRQSYLA